MTTHRRRPSAHRRGQALVEFSLALIPFLLILMGIADLGRAVYINNGVNEAAREIARTTAVHLCKPNSCTLGNSTETTDTINVQKNLVPGLGGPSSTITFTCTDVTDATVSTTNCSGRQFVKVTVSVPYAALTPLLSMIAPKTLSATAHVEVSAPYSAP